MGYLDLCQPEEPEDLPCVMPDPYTYTQEPQELERASQEEELGLGGNIHVHSELRFKAPGPFYCTAKSPPSPLALSGGPLSPGLEGFAS